MFLIHNDQTQSGKRCKQRRSGAHHHLNSALFRHLELIVSLPLGHAGIQNGDPITEASVKTSHRLIRQCYFRNQNNCLFPLLQHLIDQFHIDLRLSASGHSIQQYRTGLFLLPLPRRGICSLSLLIGKSTSVPGSRKCLCHCCAGNLFVTDADDFFLFKKIQDRFSGPVFCRFRIFHGALFQQCFQKPGSCLRPAAAQLLKQRLRRRPVRIQTNISFLF